MNFANANGCKISCAWLKTNNVDEVESCLVYNYKFEVSNNNYEVMHEKQIKHLRINIRNSKPSDYVWYNDLHFCF